MLGIVIANWNGEKLINKCLESLSKQIYKDFKVYIIDNNSKDNSKNIISEFKGVLDLELIEMEYNSGFALANNIGIAKAIEHGCKYVLTLNNDVEVPSDSLDNAMNVISNDSQNSMFQLFMINYFERNICDAAGLTFDSKLIPTQIGYREEVKDVLSQEFKIDGVCAGAAIYKCEALEKVKLDKNTYFDSNFFAYYEDVDLSLRLRSAGYKATVLKNSIVYHMHSATGNKTTGFKEYYLARNLFLYTKRNMSEENFKRSKNTYYRILFKNIIKNINNRDIAKAILKGIKDGNK